MFTDDLYEMFIAAASIEFYSVFSHCLEINESDMTHQVQELIKRLPAVNKVSKKHPISHNKCAETVQTIDGNECRTN